MPSTINCPNPDCTASYNVPDDNLGKMGRCKKCGTKFPLVPGTRAEAPRSTSNFNFEPMSLAQIDIPLPPSIGRYQVLKRLGRGGMGTVYLALDPKLTREVALKVPHPEQSRDAASRERFLREARAVAQFHHENFCPIFDIDESGTTPFLVMAYIKGRSLDGLIEPGVPWELARAAETIQRLAVALAEAHRQGIVHRDLKPANVMVDTKDRLVLMDFGLARRFESDDPTFTAAGAILGTPAYMPPEQADGDIKAIGPQSDIYSLGVILYELMAGRRPFDGPVTRVLAQILMTDPLNPSDFNKSIDPALESICLKAMAKKPRDRYETMEIFAGALTEYLGKDITYDIVHPIKPFQRTNDTVSDKFTMTGMEYFDNGQPHEQLRTEIQRGKSSRVDHYLMVYKRIAPTVVLAALSFGLLYLATGKYRDKIDSTVEREETSKLSRDNKAKPPKNLDHLQKVVNTTPQPQSNIPDISRSSTAPKKEESDPFLKDDNAIIKNSIGMRFKLITAGEFMMGSDASERESVANEMVNGKKHLVRITRQYYMGIYEVKQAEYLSVMGANPSVTYLPGRGKEPFALLDKSNLPVENVTWINAISFCNKLSEREHLSPCYSNQGTRIAGGTGYRLPTEAEWEYACRAGTSTTFEFGNQISLDRVNYNANRSPTTFWNKGMGLGHTIAVGSYRANAFGLFDMHGNIFEWCADFYDEKYYSQSPTDNPLGPSSSPTHVIRGGSWGDPSASIRAASRDGRLPMFRHAHLGFRVARDRPEN